jgi:hypothetical protein
VRLNHRSEIEEVEAGGMNECVDAAIALKETNQDLYLQLNG